MLSRYQAHNIAVQGGWKVANECRREEGYNPMEGGNTPRYPLNMHPAGGGPDWNEQGGQPGKATKKKKKPGKAGKGQEEEDDQPGGRKDDDGKAMDGDKNYALLKAGFAPVLEDAAQRIAAAEIRTLRTRSDKAADDRGRYLAWAGEWYADERPALVQKTLAPIAAALGIVYGGLMVLPGSLFAMPRQLAEAEDIPALLETWSSNRAQQILEQLHAAFFSKQQTGHGSNTD